MCLYLQHKLEWQYFNPWKFVSDWEPGMIICQSKHVHVAHFYVDSTHMTLCEIILMDANDIQCS